MIGGSKRVSWQALALALEKEADFDLREISEADEIDAILDPRRRQTLIVEVPHDRPRVDYQEYIDQNPGLVILGLDPDSAEVIVRMRDIGLDVLGRLIRTATTDPASRDAESDRPRLRLLRPRDVHQLASDLNRQDQTAEARRQPPEPASHEHLTDALRWLDLCLHRRLRHENEAAEGGYTPAWAMTAGRARALLSEEFASVSEEQLDAAQKQLEAAVFTPEAGCGDAGFLRVCEAFGLSPEERQILLMALAPELDGRYARVFGFLNDDLTRRRPTATLVAQLLSKNRPAWGLRHVLSDDRPLGLHRLLTLDPRDLLPGSESGLVPAPEIVSFLLMLTAASDVPGYGPFISVTPTVGSAASPDSTELSRLLARWREVSSRTPEAVPMVQLAGDEAVRRWFEGAVLENDTIVTFDLEGLEDHGPTALKNGCLAVARVAMLHDAVLLVVGRTSLEPSRREWFDCRLLAELSRRAPRVAVHGDATWITRARVPVRVVERPALSCAGRAALWQGSARALGLELPEDQARAIAATVHFGEPEIEATLRLCGGSIVDPRQLQAAARRVAHAAVPSSVRRIEAGFGWDDIVLPDPIRDQLHQIPSHVRHAGEVLDDWGYRARMPYGHGIAALFSGPSGTGKTMAAQIIAGELGVDLFQVDLSKTVSKYIGETEKNLDAIFAAAEAASAVLLFDEADALFGKRTEVRDAHDRYANVEVAYLLQRMESYAGLAVLTTNLRQNLDSSFMRRLRFVVEFPRPDGGAREEIWRRVFPRLAPLGADVSFGFLARQLDLTGGDIQQIAIRAAFAAITDGGSIEMRHIFAATREELRKLGMVSAEKSLAEVAA